MTAEPQESHSTGPFQEFFRTEAAAGALLVICACAALVVANSASADTYHRLWATPLALAIAGGGHTLSLTLHQWINDGLMAIFFLLVGLEIKREALAGELASPRQAALPFAAAIGGMVVPASVYLLSNGGGMEVRGWAIPMATDIAFALGVLALVAPRAPSGLKVFLTALAIVDDMGAVLVIALFYTGDIAWGALGAAGVILLLLIALNVLRVRRLTPYLALGLGLWFFVHESGVHATIAGVLLAFVIPTRTRINAADFSTRARGLLELNSSALLVTFRSTSLAMPARISCAQVCEPVRPEVQMIIATESLLLFIRPRGGSEVASSLRGTSPQRFPTDGWTTADRWDRRSALIRAHPAP
jgi:NhaA family Na+:H+ antiporter